MPNKIFIVVFFMHLSLYSMSQDSSTNKNSTKSIEGLWEAKRVFGSGIAGQLLIKENKGGWSAEIAGYFVQANLNGNEISFEIPGGKGSFKGNVEGQGKRITGYWFQDASMTSGLMAFSLILTKKTSGLWEGNVVSCPNEITFYLMIKKRADGTLGSFLRNPERNIGRAQYPIDHVEHDGSIVKFFAADKGGNKGKLLTVGKYDEEEGLLSVYFPIRGGYYDFRKVDSNEWCNFYPRGLPHVKYNYIPPLAFNDGWQVGSLEDVGISRDSIEKFIQMVIDNPMDSLRSMEDHGILIARHGKLVLEEYFHGENREKVHETRSASKSLASEMMGASMFKGVPISPSSFVYKVMNNNEFPAGLDSLKRSLTVEHLLTMSSGFDCDDDDDKSAGKESNVWNQTNQPDFYKWTMNLKMIREPGEKGVYCSASANLVGGVVSHAAKKYSLTLFHDLIAVPLQIKKYYLLVTPAREFYLGGGSRFLPRDFMKIGQLHLNGGLWNGRRIYTTEWSRRAIASHGTVNKSQYGYLWWITQYSYKGRNLTAYFASGNGGQTIITIPELDLVMAFYGGNYSDAGSATASRVYVPKYILPAVDDKN